MDKDKRSALHHSSTPPSQPVEVAAGLIFRNGKLLITQRRPGDHLGGLWEFPGGKRIPDESFEQCLRRELHEELGVVVEVEHLLETITHEYPEKTVHLKFFRCTWLSNPPQALGCHAFAWINSHQLSEYAFPAADARLLQKLRSSPELWQDK
jgi:mutator protein MutT